MVEKIENLNGSEKKEENNITEDESIVYDRQIRLWGLDAQKRLRRTCILMIGVKVVTVEAAKNIVLAGIDTLVLCDQNTVSQDDVKKCFLLNDSHIGKNKAEAAIEQLQPLNPNVKLLANPAKVEDLTSVYLSKFDIIIANGCSLEHCIFLDTFCRSKNTKFYTLDQWGSMAYFFSDLNCHQYVQEVKSLPVKAGMKRSHDGTPVASASANVVDLEDDEPSESGGGNNSTSNDKKFQNMTMQIDDDDVIIQPSSSTSSAGESSTSSAPKQEQPVQEETSTYKSHTIKFSPFTSFINEMFNTPKKQIEIRKKRFDYSLFAIYALLQFRETFNRDLSSKTRDEDLKYLLGIRQKLIAKHDLDESRFSLKYLWDVFEERPIIGAITGGVFAQEVIHAISGTEKPFQNVFVHNAVEQCGYLHCIGTDRS